MDLFTGAIYKAVDFGLTSIYCCCTSFQPGVVRHFAFGILGFNADNFELNMIIVVILF